MEVFTIMKSRKVIFALPLVVLLSSCNLFETPVRATDRITDRDKIMEILNMIDENYEKIYENTYTVYGNLGVYYAGSFAASEQYVYSLTENLPINDGDHCEYDLEFETSFSQDPSSGEYFKNKIKSYNIYDTNPSSLTFHSYNVYTLRGLDDEEKEARSFNSVSQSEEYENEISNRSEEKYRIKSIAEEGTRIKSLVLQLFDFNEAKGQPFDDQIFFYNTDANGYSIYCDATLYPSSDADETSEPLLHRLHIDAVYNSDYTLKINRMDYELTSGYRKSFETKSYVKIGDRFSMVLDSEDRKFFD